MNHSTIDWGNIKFLGLTVLILVAVCGILVGIEIHWDSLMEYYSNRIRVIDTFHESQYQCRKMKEIQETLYELPFKIAENDYHKFNDDMELNNFEFKNFSKGLLLNTISNKTILFFGDSTTFMFYNFLVHCTKLYAANIDKASCNFDGSLINDKWKQYEAQTDKLKRFFDKNLECWNEIIGDINTSLIMCRNKEERNINELFSLYESFIDYKPDIIVFNPSSLHLLHLYPERKFEKNAFEIIDNFDLNLIKIYNVSQKISNCCLIYRGASPMCYLKDNGRYKQVRNIYRMSNKSNDEYIKWMNECVKIFHSKEKCNIWTELNKGGIQYSNEMMYSFVMNMEKQERDKVFYYNRYPLFHQDKCEQEAKDTCHWLPSYGADAYYFLNFLQIAC